MKEPDGAGKYQVDNDKTVQGQVIGDNPIIYMNFQPDRVQNQKNRENFLTFLRTRYNNVQEQSLRGTTLMTLGLRTKPEAIVDTLPLTYRHLNQTEEQGLSPGTSITEAYDQASKQLLILGEPGAGKSTLLLYLAQDLLTRAEHDKEHPLPVILNLSSWAQKRRPLEQWLVEALLMSYEGVISRKIGVYWVQTGQILLLLDGLDEVATSALGSCIDAIHDYRHDHPVPLVVCSRTKEYLSQQHRLRLQKAVMVQPLSTEQIDDDLETAGSQLAAVRTALQNNQVLRELAVSPLMLNVLTLTYRNASIGDLPVSGSVEEQQREVFARYVKRMLGTNKTSQKRRSQQMLSRLIWLARQMQRHGQTEFYLEQLQPSWLSQKRLIQMYEFWAICLPGFIIGALLSLTLSRFLLLSDPIVFPFFGGLLGGIFSQGNVSHQSAERGRKTGRFLWQSLLRWLSIGAFVGTGIGLSFGCSALLLQVLFRTSSQASTSSTIPQISKGFLLQHLMRRTTSYNAILVAFMVGLSYGLSVGLSNGLSVGLSDGLSNGLSYGLSAGLSMGLLAGLFDGGLAYLRHYTLRFLLWREGSIPWKLPQLLDEAARHILLRKIGGGYVFIHRLFLDYIASLDASSPLSLETSEQQTSYQSIDNSNEGHKAT